MFSFVRMEHCNIHFEYNFTQTTGLPLALLATSQILLEPDISFQLQVPFSSQQENIHSMAIQYLVELYLLTAALLSTVISSRATNCNRSSSFSFCLDLGVLFALPLGFVFHALLAYRPCSPLEASTVRRTGSCFA